MGVTAPARAARSLKMDGWGSGGLGAGVGLRREHYGYVLENRPAVGWFEVISENFMVEGGRPLRVLEQVRADYPVVLHGVAMSLGASEPLDLDYLRGLARLAQRCEPAWLSDHLCWTGAGGRNLHDLLPLPFTAATVKHVAARIAQAQEVLGRRLVIENISSYLQYRESEMTEWEFVREVAAAADCGILLDINNIYVNACNHGFAAREYIAQMPRERVVQFHLAGHRDCGSYLLDTHDQPICPEVWRLFEYAVARIGPVATLIERDDNLPEFPELLREVEAARVRLAAAGGAGG